MVPFHLSIISALTIGVPSFFLAMEPNYERVSGHFIRGVLRKAFPGGLTNIIVVLTAQAVMAAFGLPQDQISAVCTAILAAVGMLVLYQTCRPFGKFRAFIWWAMAVGLVGCFTLLGGLFDLQISLPRVQMVMAALLVATPAVFFAMQWAFDLGDGVVTKVRSKNRSRKLLDKK
jgi:cation-transporting ATPase E